MNKLIRVDSKLSTVEIATMTGKRHDNVLRDTRVMLVELYGEKDLLRFEGICKDSYGRDQPCYVLPKNDVLTLVSGYSIPLRSKIVRRLDELESAIKNNLSQMPYMVEDLEATIKMAKIFGLEGNQALISANTAIKNIHGFDCMEALDIKQLESPDKIQYFTPTLLGKKIGLSASKFNKLLAKSAMQYEERDTKNRLVWVVTEKGKPHCQMLDTQKKTGGGSPIMQIKWAESVLAEIDNQEA